MTESFSELVQRCQGNFTPTRLDDFVGMHTSARTAGARAIATLLEKAVRLARQCNNAPLKFLLNGEPGLGKSALALYVQHLLGCNKWTTTRKNGTAVKVEFLENLERDLQSSNLFGDYRLVMIDEADAIPTVAQVRFLTLLDELPNGTALVCTSNCKLRHFEPRFQSRFQVFELEGPQAHETELLLRRFVDPDTASGIAEISGGNVRAALLDALGALQAAA